MIRVSDHAIERYFERVFGKSEEASKNLSQHQKDNITMLIQKEIYEEHPTAIILKKGLYHCPLLGVSIRINDGCVVTVLDYDKKDTRLKGGAVRSAKKFAKTILNKG